MFYVLCAYQPFERLAIFMVPCKHLYGDKRGVSAKLPYFVLISLRKRGKSLMRSGVLKQN